MAKDSKGHGSDKRLLGKTGRTAKEYDAFLRTEGSPETLARKRASKGMDARDPVSHKTGHTIKAEAKAERQAHEAFGRVRSTTTNKKY